jgi:DNA modification methylase
MPLSDVIIKGHSTAESRWATLGPYYAMFPLGFAFDTVQKYSERGDYILDPFAGRFSSIFSGSITGRRGLGIEINPVGWLYGFVKLNPAPFEKVIERLKKIYKKRDNFKTNILKMPEFFRVCYCDEVLKFLLSARKNLKWKTNKIDATLMALILLHLHGKIGEGLSNQMKMTKAMGINYSINWWKEHNMENPPQINPFEFLYKKIEWRYEKGIPKTELNNKVIYDDSTKYLAKNANRNNNKYSLLFTSPPYCAVTNYHSDQWLRCWMLGGVANPLYLNDKYKKRFGNKIEYYDLLDTVFKYCAIMMKKNATIYVRTDIREFTKNTTIEILKKHFPSHKMEISESSVPYISQTQVMGNKSSKKGEIDIIMLP